MRAGGERASYNRARARFFVGLCYARRVAERTNSRGFFTGAAVGTLGGLVGLGGAEFRLPILLWFGFAPLEAVIINKAMSLVVVAAALPFRLVEVPWSDVVAEWP